MESIAENNIQHRFYILRTDQHVFYYSIMTGPEPRFCWYQLLKPVV